ncbi:hypothetical protein ACN20G_31930 (plasmid) [Streptomyces sp. BI20]|uniref:hypothetical protein n=1 Tax=Streptomyces sp. BI20 TaxID=3403460 RepID=UPI003C77E171
MRGLVSGDGATAGPEGETVAEDRLVAGPGGAMTEEVGVITGDVTVRTVRSPRGQVAHLIQYTDADEWYLLSFDSGSAPDESSDSSPERRHREAVERVRAGWVDPEDD